MKIFLGSKNITSYVVLGVAVVLCLVLGLKIGERAGVKKVTTAPTSISQADETASSIPMVNVKDKPPKVVKPVEKPSPPKSDEPPPESGNDRVPEHKEKFGKSVDGRPLEAYVMGDGTNVTIIFGAFHGNEQSTNGVVDLLHHYLKGNPKLLVGKTVVLVPIVNPDGLRRDKRTNAHGVDINRNFPGTWKKKAAKARYNPGPKPASEPETKAVISLMDKYNPTKAISIHEPFHTMNYTGEPGKELAQLMRKFNHYPITPDIGYPTPGSFGDYCGKKLGIAIVTLEMRNESASSGWASNKKALLAAIAH